MIRPKRKIRKHGVVLPQITRSSYCNTVSEKTYKEDFMTKVEKPEAFKNFGVKLSPCDVIFQHVSKPNDYLFCKSINVFEDRWRVNIYSRREVEGIEGKYISQSYFVKFDEDKNKLEIVSPKI